MNIVSQAAADLGLEWNQGNVVNLTWAVPNVDWSGTYTGAVRSRDTDVLLTITATLGQVEIDGDDVNATVFTATMSAALSATIPEGEHPWYAKSGDLTRFAGVVYVLP